MRVFCCEKDRLAYLYENGFFHVENKSKYVGKIDRLLNETFMIFEDMGEDEFTEYDEDDDEKYGQVKGIMKQKRDALMNYLVKRYEEGGDDVERAKFKTGVNRYERKGKEWKKAIDDIAPYDSDRLNPEVNQTIKDCSIALSKVTSDMGEYREDDIEKLPSSKDNVSKKRGYVQLPGMSKGYTPYEIIQGKKFIDLMGLSFLYDKSYLAAHPNQEDRYGLKFNDGKFNLDDIDVNDISKSQIEKYRKDKTMTFNRAKSGLGESIVIRYLESKYGVTLETPINFAKGNAKLEKTLIVNFTAAWKCPAWNECLVKHACYARSGEKTHRQVYDSNERKHFMWILCEGDETLKGIVFDYLKTCVINYEAMANKSLKITGKKYTPDELFDMTFDELNDLGLVNSYAEGEQVDKEVADGVIKVNNIRLNENGDFISAGILDIFDGYAREFSKIGVVTSAYTCRNLAKKPMKNIVLNASVTGVKNADRYFVAVPEDVYNSLPDTFQSTNTLPDKYGSMSHSPKYLGKNGSKQNLYYKCPCGNNSVKLSSDKKDSSVNCYHCRICYNKPSAEVLSMLPEGGKIVVFVKAHGTSKGSLVGKNSRNMIDTWFGYPINESAGAVFNQDEGVGIVADNAIYSMNAHFASMTLNECYTNRKRAEFFEKLNMLNG